MLTMLTILMTWMITNSIWKLKTPLNISTLMLLLMLVILQFKKSVSNFSSCTMMSVFNNLNTFMILLSLWVTMMMVMVSLKYQQMNNNPMLFNSMISILAVTVISFFMTDNLMMLYVMFEVSLLPTLVLVIKWGYQPERLKSGFYFMMYTICASLPLLSMILKMKHEVFSTTMCSLMPLMTFNTNILSGMTYMAATTAFMVKVPMWGVHLWLPKAHVEAPVSGSMVLAGILLKLGGYGLLQMLKILYKLFSKIKLLFFSINMWGAVIVGFVCLSSIDIKSLIAYSSIIHMNMMVLGLLSNSMIGIYGSVLMMISHGISSPGMFAMANLNYENTKTRNLMMQKGLMKIQPKLAMLWFVLIAANMAAPPSLNLASEILIYASVLKMSFILCLMIILITFMSGAYNLYLYSMQQGNPLKVSLPNSVLNEKDIMMSISHSLPVYTITLIFYMMF